MSEKLIIRLGSHVQESIFWIVWSDAQQEIIASGELPDASALATLAERAGNRPVVTLVPGRDVTLTSVDLPARANRKALAAIPFMLEDELSDDIDHLFFAMGSKQGNQQQVAVVRHQQMQIWLEMLSDAGLSSHTMLPDCLAVPLHDEGLSLLQLGEHWLIRQDHWLAHEGEASWLMPMLELLAKQQEQPLQLHCYSPAPQFTSSHIHCIAEPLDAPLQVLAQHYADTHFNLLQGEYKTKPVQSGNWRKWRLAASLAGIALLASLTDKVLQVTALDNEQQTIQTQIVAEFKKALPNNTRVGDARQIRSQIKAELNRLQQGGSGVSVLAMLNQLGDAFAQSQVKPQLIRFDADRAELRMQASAADIAALERFKQAAQRAGFSIEQGAINNRDNGVISTLTVRS